MGWKEWGKERERRDGLERTDEKLEILLNLRPIQMFTIVKVINCFPPAHYCKAPQTDTLASSWEQN